MPFTPCRSRSHPTSRLASGFGSGGLNQSCHQYPPLDLDLTMSLRSRSRHTTRCLPRSRRSRILIQARARPKVRLAWLDLRPRAVLSRNWTWAFPDWHGSRAAVKTVRRAAQTDMGQRTAATAPRMRWTRTLSCSKDLRNYRHSDRHARIGHICPVPYTASATVSERECMRCTCRAAPTIVAAYIPYLGHGSGPGSAAESAPGFGTSGVSAMFVARNCSSLVSRPGSKRRVRQMGLSSSSSLTPLETNDCGNNYPVAGSRKCGSQCDYSALCTASALFLHHSRLQSLLKT